MGIEGQKSPRDVASEEQKHPWEVFPESEASAIKEGEKKREKLEKKKANREKRNAKMHAMKEWMKKHRILILVIVIVLIIAIGAGIFALFKWKESQIEAEKQAAEEDDEALIMYGYPEGYTISDALTSVQAFSYANDVVREIAMEGVDKMNPSSLKVEDNMDNYIATIKNEDEKLFYTLFKYYIIANVGDTDRARYLLDLFDEKHTEMNRKQLYAYYKAWAEYYDQTGEKELRNEYHRKIREEFKDETFIIVDTKTGEVIEDEEMMRNLENAGWGTIK